MANDLVPFLFEGTSVRVIEMSVDEPWFVATDVAAILGYRDAEKITRLLDVDEKGTLKVSTPGGDQALSIISEPGLYKVISRSNKPAAKRFDRWVRHDVLPSIRRTGSYRINEKTENAKRRLDIQAFNSAHRHLSQMHREGWANSEIRKARATLFLPLGIKLDPNALQQGELDLGAERMREAEGGTGSGAEA